MRSAEQPHRKQSRVASLACLECSRPERSAAPEESARVVVRTLARPPARSSVYGGRRADLGPQKRSREPVTELPSSPSSPSSPARSAGWCFTARAPRGGRRRSKELEHGSAAIREQQDEFCFGLGLFQEGRGLSVIGASARRSTSGRRISAREVRGQRLEAFCTGAITPFLYGINYVFVYRPSFALRTGAITPGDPLLSCLLDFCLTSSPSEALSS